MKWRTFSIRALLTLTLVVAIVSLLWPKPDPHEPDPVWRKTLFANREPLSNFPEVKLTGEKDGWVNVTATNNRATTLEYRVFTSKRITLCQEVRSESEWKQHAWSQEGMCEGHYEIAPGQAVNLEVEVFDDSEVSRMLGKFSEKGTDRSGLVVLATRHKVQRADLAGQ